MFHLAGEQEFDVQWGHDARLDPDDAWRGVPQLSPVAQPAARLALPGGQIPIPDLVALRDRKTCMSSILSSKKVFIY